MNTYLLFLIASLTFSTQVLANAPSEKKTKLELSQIEHYMLQIKN